MNFLNNLISSLLAVIISLVIGFWYRVYFRERTDAIRSRLKSKRVGKRRKRYVQVFVDSIRGGADIYITKVLWFLMLLFPLGMTMTGTYVWGEALISEVDPIGWAPNRVE